MSCGNISHSSNSSNSSNFHELVMLSDEDEVTKVSNRNEVTFALQIRAADARVIGGGSKFFLITRAHSYKHHMYICAYSYEQSNSSVKKLYGFNFKSFQLSLTREY